MPTLLQKLRKQRDALAEEVGLRNWYSGDPDPSETRAKERELERLDALLEGESRRRKKRKS